MKTLFSPLSVFYLGLALAIFSCEGPEGPQGPTGTAGAKGDIGATGTAGAKGDKGDTGSANVVYTDWFHPTWANYYRAPDNSMAQLFNPATAQAILTEEAFNKSAIHVYIKFKTIEYVPQDQEYRLVDRITNANNTWSWSKIPGRTTNNPIDFFNNIYTSIGEIGVNFFNPYVEIRTYVYDAATQKNVPVSEYAGKTAADFREIAKDLLQYRIVVIPGAILSGRQKAVDFSNYEEVKAAFGLVD